MRAAAALVYPADMRRHVRPLALTLGMLLAAGCGRLAAAPRDPSRLACPAPWNAGSRLPGVLNPAYPSTGLYPAPGGEPPASAPGVTLRALAPTLVVDYGQPLESGAVTTRNEVVQGTASAGWWSAPLAAGYPFRLFGPGVPLFGLIPGPVRSGAQARGVHDVWLVTEWDAAQTLTVLRGTPSLVGQTPGWNPVPSGISAANTAQAAAEVRRAESDGWTELASAAATPACDAAPTQINPFGDRAELRLPLGVPVMLISPEYGSTVLEVTAG